MIQVKDNLIYLRLILGAIEKITMFLDKMDYDSFSIDIKTQSAVIMQLQVIGELTKRIPDNILSSIELPWRKIAGLRDMVSHDYFNLDIKMIWQTIKGSIPEADKKIRQYSDGLN